MFGHERLALCGVAACLLSLAAAPSGVRAQGLHDTLRAKDRVFPAIGPGVSALKRDSSGRYFIVAEPATAVFIYSATGNLVGRIPNANSRGATITYAVSIDIDSQDRLFVADRGANAVKVFGHDGSFVASVPVTAPTSVVALSGGQFAVTQLHSKRLIQIMDEGGSSVRTFGDPMDQPDGQPAKELVLDRGRITGDSSGNIYFAFTSLPDPTLQRFDRFGYSAYDATIAAETFGPVAGRAGHEVDLGYKMSGLGGPESVTAWTDLHSLTGVSVGAGGRRGGRGRGTASSGDSEQSVLPGDALAYTADAGSYPAGADSSPFDSFDSNVLGLGGGPMMPGMFGMGLGGGFHERMPGMFGGEGGGGFGSRGEFGARPSGEGFAHRPGFDTYRATATVRIALDDPSKHRLEKPVITAVGVDPETQDAWAAIADTLVHFDSNGNRLDIFYIATPSGASLKPTSILVEPDRILIADDPLGIFEFPRPDKVAPAPPASKADIVPQQIPSAPKAAPAPAANSAPPPK